MVANAGLKSLFAHDKDDITLESYENIFKTIPNVIPVASRVRMPRSFIPSDDDRLFGYQRIAGMNPSAIIGVASMADIPDAFKITTEAFCMAMVYYYGDDHGITSLESEVARGHIFLCDYGILSDAGLVGSYEHEGVTRYCCAPFCLCMQMLQQSDIWFPLLFS